MRPARTSLMEPLQEPQPPKTLVIYAGDAAYAYPMLISARSVRQQTRSTPFDIWIFAADYPADLLERVSAAAATIDAKVVPLSSEAYLRFDPARYQTAKGFAHLRPPVLSRLVTGPLVPDTYDQVLYLDGDTLCVADMGPLLRFRAPAGRLLGTADSINYFKRDNGHFGASTRALMEGLGLSVDDTWYNTGVLMAERKTWAERGAAALEFFLEHIDVCKFPVDGSTNATAKGLWLPISCRWNFMAPMRMWGLDAAIEPAFYHFTGKEKPWLGRMAPWQDFWERYATFRCEPPIGALAGPLASRGVVAGINRHRVICRIKGATVHAARAARARQGVLDSERLAAV